VFSCIANTVTNENYRELDALVEFSRKLGVNRTLIFNFIPVGGGADIIDMDLPRMRGARFAADVRVPEWARRKL